MHERDTDELLRIVSRLNKIAERLIALWPDANKVEIRRAIEDFEKEVQRARAPSKTAASMTIFSDKSVFPSKETIVAYIESEFGVHMSPDWQRSRLEKEASKMAAGKSYDGIREVASRLAKQRWTVKPAARPQKWKELFGKSAEQIRAELNDVQKFPSVNSIKEFASGLLTYDDMKSISKRETLVEKIVMEVTRHAAVSRLGE